MGVARLMSNFFVTGRLNEKKFSVKSDVGLSCRAFFPTTFFSIFYDATKD